MIRVLAALAGVLVIGCGNTKTETPTPTDFAAAALDRDIFQPSCAFASCHGGGKPAAGLGLGKGLCGAMIEKPSCLFPSRRLVVPGHPEQSFLLNKLTGQDLPAKPDTDCSTTGDNRMPYGGTPLTPLQIARVSAWIEAGAACAEDGTPVMTGDGGAGGPPNTLAPDGGTAAPTHTLALVLASTRLAAGARATVSLTISPPVEAGGTSLTLDATDRTALGVPSALFVAEGTTEISFEIVGKRPVASVGLTAALAGPSPRAEAQLAVDGLYIAEVFYGTAAGGAGADRTQWVKIVNATTVPINLAPYRLGAGRSRYDETAAGLGGVIAGGACAIVGGPDTSGDNGAPVYQQALDFSPDIPRPDASEPAVGVGLFTAGPGENVDFVAVPPVDAVLIGSSNPAGLMGADGRAATPAMAGLATGHSLARASATAWMDRAAPAPADCPRW